MAPSIDIYRLQVRTHADYRAVEHRPTDMLHRQRYVDILGSAVNDHHVRRVHPDRICSVRRPPADGPHIPSLGMERRLKSVPGIGAVVH